MDGVEVDKPRAIVLEYAGPSMRSMTGVVDNLRDLKQRMSGVEAGLAGVWIERNFASITSTSVSA